MSVAKQLRSNAQAVLLTDGKPGGIPAAAIAGALNMAADEIELLADSESARIVAMRQLLVEVLDHSDAGRRLHERIESLLARADSPHKCGADGDCKRCENRRVAEDAAIRSAYEDFQTRYDTEAEQTAFTGAVRDLLNRVRGA